MTTKILHAVAAYESLHVDMEESIHPDLKGYVMEKGYQVHRRAPGVWHWHRNGGKVSQPYPSAREAWCSAVEAVDRIVVPYLTILL